MASKPAVAREVESNSVPRFSDVTEQKRLNEAREAGIPWKKWEPYLSERQWGTVREDYSQDGNAWAYFNHDQSRSRAYHRGEDGLGGISDDKQRLCFALALWNERDPILKERLFGVTNSEGNHGEDVKEYDCYIDSTPTHSYMEYLYKYPQREFPYQDLAFHTTALALVDFDFAKEQLMLMLRSLYTHPNGQIPAYEWNFSDVNPPVHAWATLFLYKVERDLGREDIKFLARAFHGLTLNFNWWVNRKDPQGRNVFAGGFLGLDNIGVFDRSAPLPTGGSLEQADGTGWMPVNALIIRGLLNLYRFYGNDFTVECPAGSGNRMNLFEVAGEIIRRLASIFLRDENGQRPVFGGTAKFQEDPNWRDDILFYEYFHGDNGAGLGSNHQTGWTGVIARLLDISGRLQADDVLKTSKERIEARLVREQVGGKKK
jgi:hypothetical protein